MNNKDWIKKIRRGMIIRFSDGLIDTVIMTGHLGKSDKWANKKGRYFFATLNRFVIFWPDIVEPEIIGFSKDYKKWKQKQESWCKNHHIKYPGYN